MQNLQVFSSNEFGQVRTVEVNGDVWLVAKDIAMALELSNPSKAVGDLLKDYELVGIPVDGLTSSYPIIDSLGRTQNTTIISEQTMYDLIMKSRKKEALAFKFWITHEVLPSIRKTGSYNAVPQANKTSEEIKFDMSLALFRETSAALRYNDNSKLMMLHKTAETYGLPNTLPAYTVAKDVTFSASHLLKQFNCGISAIAFNKMLLADGYIEEKERKSSKGLKKFKCLTDKGLEYGENKVSPHNPNETQAHYYESKFQDLFKKITNNS